MSWEWWITKGSNDKEQPHRGGEKSVSSRGPECTGKGAKAISKGRNMNKTSRWKFTGVIFLFDLTFQKSEVR